MRSRIDALSVVPIDHRYHDGDGGFREQFFVLYPVGIWEDVDGVEYIKLLRTLVAVCQPGVASAVGGPDTAEAWEKLDSLIEDNGVRGIFHTHPVGFTDFSEQDRRAQIGLAQANGERFIWHGVMALGAEQAHFICMHMLQGRVMVYDFGYQKHDLDDPVILLPCPPRVKVRDGVCWMAVE